ncbi:hypothetical protein, partial [Enterobacter roggenkampii]|uniref:hypothetical protein n=1 Tax=Enterobacter roggenkampii TaxID=1812935 RepID=UPI002FFCE897
AQIREILISESAWEEMTCLFAPSLAHSDKNEVRRAYNRSTYLEQRKGLMSWWGLFVNKTIK